MSLDTPSSSRFIALDIHKHYAVVAAVDREGEVVLKPRKVTNEQLPVWGTAHLCPDDRVVIESTTNAWHVYDLLAPLVAEVKVANPIRIKQIAEARTKTDKRDALILARLLAANLIPAVWVPPGACAGIVQIGRKSWKQETNYHRRSLAETVTFRLKTIFGPRLQSWTLAQQGVEVRLRRIALNQMTQLGMRDSYPVITEA